VDEGEIGRGAYGTVNQMVHSRSGTVMAVKVGTSFSDPYVAVDSQIMFRHCLAVKIYPIYY